MFRTMMSFSRDRSIGNQNDRSADSSSESLQDELDTPRRSVSNCGDDLSTVKRLLVLPEVRVKNSPPQRRLSGRGPSGGSQDYTTAGFSSVNPSFDAGEVTEDVIFGLGNGLTSKQLRTLFPYHIVVNADFNITQMGSKLSSFFKHRTTIRAPAYEHIGKFFRVSSPLNTPWEWNAIAGLRSNEIEIELIRDFIPESRSPSMYGDDAELLSFALTGSIYIMNPREDHELISYHAMFFVTPKIQREQDLRKWDARMSDIPPHFFQKYIIEHSEKRNFDTDEIQRLRAEKIRLEEENERLKLEMKQQDLRHMVANVAHDLKTPLTAFLGGVEVIDHATEDIFHALEQTPDHEMVERVHSAVTEMSVSIKSIRDINSFMTMTINRCIDYTKASQGLKLTPKYETIDLANVLMLPLSVMQSLQSKVGMSLLPISDEICTHIITDKQWLQENILCLLSNAVKYSYQGTVNVSMYLHHPAETVAGYPVSPPHVPLFSSSPNNQGQLLLRANNGVSSSSSSNVTLPTAKQLQIMYSQRTSRTSFSTSAYNMGSSSGKGTPVERIRSLDSTLVDEEATPLAPISEASSPVYANRKVINREASNSDKTHDTVPILNAPSTSTKSRTFMDKLAAKGLVMLDMSEPALTNHYLKPLPPMLVIEVEDTGIGLTDEAMENLFNPFRQAQRLAGGTGLGLYSLSKRMEALNGHYGVERRRDGTRGSMFWFSFPYRPDVEMSRQRPTKRMSTINLPPLDVAKFEELAVAAPAQPLPPLSSRLTPKGGSDDRHLYVLVVDDSVTILKMTTTMLRKHGHKVDTAENGAEALEKIAARLQTVGMPYDVVLMDLLMPVMDGLETMRRLREQENAEKNNLMRHTIIGVSANADQDVVVDALAAGADEFLCKPFSMQNFRETFDKISNH